MRALDEFGMCVKVWNFVIKVDPEAQTLFATDRTGMSIFYFLFVGGADGSGGITVTDCNTSKPLFEIRGVRPFAHLEFAKGHVIFDTGNGTFPIYNNTLWLTHRIRA